MGLHQTKKLSTAKEISNKTLMLPSEREKIFANNTFNKGFIWPSNPTAGHTHGGNQN